MTEFLVDGKFIGKGADGIATANLVNNAVTPGKAKLDDVWPFTANPTMDADPTIANDLTRKSYVDAQALGSKTWKELLLHGNQLLDGASGGILQAMPIYIATLPAASDNFIISDGSTTETFTFVGAAPGAFDVLIVGGDAPATLVNLVAEIELSSTLWSAVDTSGLDRYFAGTPAAQAVVYRTATSTAADRLFSSVAVSSDIKVVEFATGTQDYRIGSGTESTLPTSDPTAKRFGFGRLFANLTTNETHITAEDNFTSTNDTDDQVWQQTDVGAVTAGNALTKSGNTINLVIEGSSGGLTANANDLQINYGTVSELAVVDAGAEVAGVSELLSPADHKHQLTTGTPVDVGTANAAGSGVAAALANHVHKSTKWTADDKARASAATSGNESTTALTISNTPALDGYVQVVVAGLQFEVGDGVKTKACYFSSDGGTTARSISAIESGDTLFWNSTITGIDLAATDFVDMNYETL